MKTSNVIAKKKLGQNFLVDQKIINGIVDAVVSDKEISYFEIGPGTGALTVPISKLVKKLTLIEIDTELVARLTPWLNPDVKIINQDFLKFDLAKYLNSESVIFGNLPYYITTEIIEKIFTYSNRINYAVVMIQKDVADKIISNKKGKDMSYLGLLVNYVFNPKVIIEVSKNSFIPKPNVDSSVLKLETKNNLSTKNFEKFKTTLIGLLKQRRKTLNNNLKDMNITTSVLKRIKDLVPDLNLRVETLNPELIYRLIEIIIED